MLKNGVTPAAKVVIRKGRLKEEDALLKKGVEQ
jgi:hypothetical protein